MKQPDRRPQSTDPGLPETRDGDLEDALYLQADKLLALCSVQAAWVTADCDPSPATRHHYSIIMEEQALELRRLLDRLFA